MKLPEQLQEYIDELHEFNQPEEKYELLIEYGSQLPELDEQYQQEKNLVPGCLSIVYIHSEERDGKVYFQGKADAILVKGLVYILTTGLSGMNKEEFLTLEPTFLTELGLQESLTPSRANASVNIFKLMKQQIEQ